jgi:hypothetical protein
MVGFLLRGYAEATVSINVKRHKRHKRRGLAFANPLLDTEIYTP